MFEELTRQSLPTPEYRELVGMAVCVFNANNAFIIENIVRESKNVSLWYTLVDSNSRDLCRWIRKYLPDEFFDITELFDEIVTQRNRIVHSFQYTTGDGQQELMTKEKIQEGNKQFPINEEYLKEFIRLNNRLNQRLDDFRIMSNEQIFE